MWPERNIVVVWDRGRCTLNTDSVVVLRLIDLRRGLRAIWSSGFGVSRKNVKISVKYWRRAYYKMLYGL